MRVFFADSYAIIDYLKGNKRYVKYFEDNEIITTRLNLMEVYYSTLIEGTAEKADEYYDSFLGKCVDAGDETIKSAMKFRARERKKKLSYIDALGYRVALENKIKFLTGDIQFRGMKDVEFVK
ncbi:MAG: PIN domain-containing protein [Candidatus Diapherotrites archaeon]|nr:PIN domain-containing protein [Candidatus Micrarchaeota archaeon]MBU1939766.1 PIN domain-containing protein [Candidatus Micrarchaeota archaeon]